MRKLCLIVLSALALLAGAGCFGGNDAKKVDAEDWVDDLCKATDDLDEAETEAFFDYDSLFDVEDVDGEEVRDALLDYVEAYNEALDDFVDELDEIGEPDVREGGKLLAAVREFVEEERKSVDRAGRRAKELDEKGQDLAEAVDEIFFDIKFADLLELFDDSGSPDADDVIELIDEDIACAGFLFSE